ncbi:MAG: GNAT family N-acetyltransferase [Rhizomicrobium sp.]
MIRDAESRDWPAILAQNEAWVHDLSPMDAATLDKFARTASYLRVVEREGEAVAFLLAFRRSGTHDGAVFRHFAADGGPDFFYVDRIIVDAGARMLGLATRLYDDLAAVARAAGAGRLTCEVNAEPPNEGSLAFHRRYGFREVGRMPHNRKTVALFEIPVRGPG